MTPTAVSSLLLMIHLRLGPHATERSILPEAPAAAWPRSRRAAPDLRGSGACAHAAPRVASPDAGLVDGGQLGAADRVDADVAARNLPFVVLLGEDGANEPDDRGPVGTIPTPGTCKRRGRMRPTCLHWTLPRRMGTSRGGGDHSAPRVERRAIGEQSAPRVQVGRQQAAARVDGAALPSPPRPHGPGTTLTFRGAGDRLAQGSGWVTVREERSGYDAAGARAWAGPASARGSVGHA